MTTNHETVAEAARLTRDLDALVDVIARIEKHSDCRVANLREIFCLDELRADALRLSNDLEDEKARRPAQQLGIGGRR